MKTLEELNLVDDFLVNSLTSHKIYGEQSARYILECILHRQIGKLTVVPQRFFVERIQKPTAFVWMYIWMRRTEKSLI